MGRNTDKLYVTQTEHSGADGRHGASTGITHKKITGSQKQLPFYYCSLTLQAWEHPVCYVDSERRATIFDLLSIVPWLQRKGTNPTTGQPLEAKDLLKLNFTKNDQEEYCDPITMKVFNDHTHIVAVKTSGNVYAYETIETLNYKAKHWNDLMTDEGFSRADVITIQDPHGATIVDSAKYAHLQEAQASATASSLKSKEGPVLSSTEKEAKVKAAREAIERLRKGTPNAVQKALPKSAVNTIADKTPPNAAHYSTGYTAASFTSTGMTVNTADDRAILTEEQYLLHPKKIKIKGLGIIKTNYGSLDIELWPEHAPKAVYNFVKLAKAQYYTNCTFHRNIPGFMIQGGDPTGKGTGGKSIFGKDFEDEISPAYSHDKRGLVCMANKGPNTNSSQFFITYETARHLDKKHTIFGHVIGDSTTLDKLERVPLVGDRPKSPIVMQEIQIVLDPFDEFLTKEQTQRELAESKKELTEDDLRTWTNKSIKRPGTQSSTGASDGQIPERVGKYLSADTSASTKTSASKEPAQGSPQAEVSVRSADHARPTKKVKKMGFGDFSGW